MTNHSRPLKQVLCTSLKTRKQSTTSPCVGIRQHCCKWTASRCDLSAYRSPQFRSLGAGSENTCPIRTLDLTLSCQCINPFRFVSSMTLNLEQIQMRMSSLNPVRRFHCHFITPRLRLMRLRHPLQTINRSIPINRALLPTRKPTV